MASVTGFLGNRSPRLKVLIVDDSVTMRAMLHGIISDQPGHDVVGVAKNAEEALSLVQSTSPNIVLIDLCMPYISGSELLTMLQDYPGIRKIILSSNANASGAVRRKLMELGATAFFDKADVARDPQAFRDDLRRIAADGGAPVPAVASSPEANIVYAADRFPIPGDEQARIRALAGLKIANLSIDPSLNVIIGHLAKTIDYPIIAVNLIDAEQVWCKAAVGFERQAFARGESFCTHVLCQDGPLTVTDATTHPLFRTLPMVIDGAQIRAYVGVPIVSEEGVTLGAVCASDRRPRRASKAELDSLRNASMLIAAFLDERARRYAA